VFSKVVAPVCGRSFPAALQAWQRGISAVARLRELRKIAVAPCTLQGDSDRVILPDGPQGPVGERLAKFLQRHA
jgi:hypothetical protein